NGRSFTTAGAFSNAGSLTAGSGSTFTVGGSNNYTQTGGSTRVNGALAVAAGKTVDIQGGTLFGAGTVTGAVNNAATVSPGDGLGKLSVTGNYVQTAAGSLNVELGGTIAVTQYDQLD